MPYKDAEAARANRQSRRERTNARQRERTETDPAFLAARRASWQAWSERNKEKVRAKNAAYRNGPAREALLAKKRADHAANREAILGGQKERRDALPPLLREARRQKCRDWHKEHRDAVLGQRRADYAADPELQAKARRHSSAQKVKAKAARLALRPASAICWQCGKEYRPRQKRQQCCSTRCADRFHTAIQNEKRRAAMVGQEDNVPPAVWREIMAYFDWRCGYCGRRGGLLTMDHVEPLSRGGRHEPYNVVPACRRCNCSKGDRRVVGFLFVNGLPKTFRGAR